MTPITVIKKRHDQMFGLIKNYSRLILADKGGNMGGTVLLLGGWISTYFGISFVWAGWHFGETDENDDPRRFLVLPGCCLLLVGALLFGFGLFRHFHRV